MGSSQQVCGWTAEAIRARLGISTCIFPLDHRLSAADIAKIRAAGIRAIELKVSGTRFDIHDRAQIDEILSECRKQGVTIVSMHGPYDVKYGAADEDKRRHALQEVVTAARLAEQMEARVFLDHFGTGAQAERSVHEILNEMAGSPLKFATETGELEPTVAFVDKIGAPNFGMTVDIGHLFDPDGSCTLSHSGAAERVMRLCADRLFHIHLHDMRLTDHIPPFYGDLLLDEVFAALAAIRYDGALLFEVHCRQASSIGQPSLSSLDAVLRKYPRSVFRKAMNLPLADLFASGPLPAEPDPDVARVRGAVRRVVRGTFTNMARRPTSEGLRAVARFPDEFMARYG